ncbi:hypothetical protein NLX69_05935 [Rossellomorea sp. BNER]|nr:hypothetical protein [Rossellomorea sp. BNER]
MTIKNQLNTFSFEVLICMQMSIIDYLQKNTGSENSSLENLLSFINVEIKNRKSIK